MEILREETFENVYNFYLTLTLIFTGILLTIFFYFLPEYLKNKRIKFKIPYFLLFLFFIAFISRLIVALVFPQEHPSDASLWVGLLFNLEPSRFFYPTFYFYIVSYQHFLLYLKKWGQVLNYQFFIFDGLSPWTQFKNYVLAFADTLKRTFRDGLWN